MRRSLIISLLILFLAFWSYNSNLSLWWLHQNHLLSIDDVEGVQLSVRNWEGTGFSLDRNATPEETNDIVRWYNDLHFFTTIYGNGFTQPCIEIFLKSGEWIILKPHRTGVEVSGTGGYGWYTAKHGELEEFFKQLLNEAKKAGQ